MFSVNPKHAEYKRQTYKDYGNNISLNAYIKMNNFVWSYMYGHIKC